MSDSDEQLVERPCQVGSPNPVALLDARVRGPEPPLRTPDRRVWTSQHKSGHQSPWGAVPSAAGLTLSAGDEARAHQCESRSSAESVAEVQSRIQDWLAVDDPEAASGRSQGRNSSQRCGAFHGPSDCRGPLPTAPSHRSGDDLGTQLIFPSAASGLRALPASRGHNGRYAYP